MISSSSALSSIGINPNRNAGEYTKAPQYISLFNDLGWPCMESNSVFTFPQVTLICQRSNTLLLNPMNWTGYGWTRAQTRPEVHGMEYTCTKYNNLVH